MGILLPELENPKTGEVWSNVYASWNLQPLTTGRYERYLWQRQDPIQGYNPETMWVVTGSLQVFTQDKSTLLGKVDLDFFVLENDIKTIPFFQLYYRELKKKFPLAVDSI